MKDTCFYNLGPTGPETMSGEVECGTHIQAASFDAVRVAQRYDRVLTFTFNDIELFAHPKMNPRQVESLYRIKRERRRDDSVS